MAGGRKSFARLKTLLGGQYAGAFIWPEDGTLDHRRVIAFDLRDPRDWPQSCASCLAIAIYQEQRLAELNAKVNEILKAEAPEPELKKGDEHAFAA
jgi:hypothetical protein